MLVPLNFDLSYDDAGLPAQVMIGYDTTTLFTLTYEYDAADPLVHTISVEDGDGELYGSYVFTLAADWRSARIDVYTDAAHTAYNGCYLIAYDEGRRAVSFTACDSAGNPVSAFEYGYEDLQGLGEQALMVAESRLGFDLGEAGDVSAVLQEIQAGDFDFTMLLRVRSAEDVARLLL